MHLLPFMVLFWFSGLLFIPPALIDASPIAQTLTSRDPLSSNKIHRDVFHRCDGPYWHLTKENWEASGANEWFSAFVKNFDKESREWKEKSSFVDLFNKQFVDIHGTVSCGLGRAQCDEMPTCNDILRSVQGDRELARRIFFVDEQIRNLNHRSRVTYVRVRCWEAFETRKSYVVSQDMETMLS